FFNHTAVVYRSFSHLVKELIELIRSCFGATNISLTACKPMRLCVRRTLYFGAYKVSYVFRIPLLACFPCFIQVLGSYGGTIGFTGIFLRGISSEKPILMFQFKFILTNFDSF